MLKDLVLQNRSYRRFCEDTEIKRATLFELISLARLTASAGNMQPLKYFLSCESETNEAIFPLLRWQNGAGRAPKAPEEGCRPTAYICMFIDTEIAKTPQAAYVDAGIAAQTILLAATEKGLGGCIVSSFDKLELKKKLKVPNKIYEPFLVIALGEPSQDITLEESGYDTETYRDELEIHHVPKRQLMDIIIGI